jgi:phospholipid transport system substrate-binding protein
MYTIFLPINASMKFVSILIIILVSMASVHASPAKEREIKNILEERDLQIKDLLGPEGSEHTDEQREQLRDIINEMMDYRQMARYALAEKFDELSRHEQDEFVDLFSRIIRDQSLQRLDIYRAEVIYDMITVDGDDAKVSTTAILNDTRIPVHYRMRIRDGEWVIADLSIDNAWTAESYRRSFQNIIRRRGYDALIDNLRRRADRA